MPGVSPGLWAVPSPKDSAGNQSRRLGRRPMPRTLSLTLLAIAAALAEESPTIIVTAERGASDLARAPVSVERVELDQISERGGALNATDWLRDLPGVGVWHTGGGVDGGTVSVRLRGLDQKYTLMLVDGVPLADQSSLDGTIRQPLFQPVGVSVVELVKGSQSGLYGSGAVGGVIDLRTIRPTATPQVRVTATAGSFATVQGEAVATGPLGDTAGYAVAVSGLHSDGFSARTAAPDGDPGDYEDDAVARYAGRARIEQRVGDATLYLATQVSRNRQDYDGSGPDDGDSFNRYRQWQVSGGGSLAAKDRYDVALDLSYQDSRNESQYGASAPGTYASSLWYGALRGNVQVLEHARVAVGVDARRDSAETAYGPTVPPSLDAEVDQFGVYVQGQWSGESLELSATGRLDQHEEFGGHPTGRLAAAWFALPRELKLRGAVSTGFRAPTLYQLYHHEPGIPMWFIPDSDGNPDLDPETSLSYEAGVDWTPTVGLELAATAFRTEVEDQIIYRSGVFPTPSTYANDHGTSVSRGVEAKLAGEQCFNATLSARLEGSYTYLDAEDASGDAAPFAPPHSGSARATIGEATGGAWRFWQGVGVRRGTTHYANIGHTDPIAGVTLADAVLGASWSERWEVTLRVDNLFDEVYVANQSAAWGQTYAGAPRSYWLTVTGRF